MLHSFRLKIGLLSAFLSGLLLLGLGLYATSMISRVGLDRVDHELRAPANAQVRRAEPPGHWRRFDDSLRSVYGPEASRQFVVKTTTVDGRDLYTSATWPPGLPKSALPLSLAGATEAVAEEPPPRDEELPPRRREDEERRPRQMRVRGLVYATIRADQGEWRAMTMANEEVTLSIAMSLSGLQAEIRRFQGGLLLATPFVLFLLAAGGWLIGHQALSPVKRIAHTVETITALRLGDRISTGRTDREFDQLIGLMNGMLGRLERSFHQATRFSADAAHELKTPLAILQAQVERCLQHAPDGSSEQREFAEQLDEVQRMKTILRKLLLLAQADAGQLAMGHERINLAALAQAVADDACMLAPDRQVSLQTPPEVWVKGDPDLLTQAVGNLISNAVKYGDAGGRITVALGTCEGNAILTVSNTGTTIPQPDREKIFDRFYRADRSRSRKVEGSGLGLSLAREIARAHGGEIALDPGNDLMTGFTLTLPLPKGCGNSAAMER